MFTRLRVVLFPCLPWYIYQNVYSKIFDISHCHRLFSSPSITLNPTPNAKWSCHIHSSHSLCGNIFCRLANDTHTKPKKHESNSFACLYRDFLTPRQTESFNLSQPQIPPSSRCVMCICSSTHNTKTLQISWNGMSWIKFIMLSTWMSSIAGAPPPLVLLLCEIAWFTDKKSSFLWESQPLISVLK